MTVWGFTGGSHCVGRDVGRTLTEGWRRPSLRRMRGFFEGSTGDGRAFFREAPGSTKPPAPGGSISSPATPRRRSRGSLRSRAPPRSASSRCAALRAADHLPGRASASRPAWSWRCVLAALRSRASARSSPSDPAAPQARRSGIAEERRGSPRAAALRAASRSVVAIGTGRTMRGHGRGACRGWSATDHKMVSLVGHISMRWLGELLRRAGAPRRTSPRRRTIRCRCRSGSVLARAARSQLLRLQPLIRVIELGQRADLRLVGVGRMDQHASSISTASSRPTSSPRCAGSAPSARLPAGPSTPAGRIIETGTNERLTSVPRAVPPPRPVVGVAQGHRQGALPIRAALRGRIINGLITNETTARSLLDLEVTPRSSRERQRRRGRWRGAKARGAPRSPIRHTPRVERMLSAGA